MTAPVPPVEEVNPDPCLLEDGTYEHDWKWISDWYGDPGVINGTADCSHWQCTRCGSEDCEDDPPSYEELDDGYDMGGWDLEY